MKLEKHLKTIMMLLIFLMPIMAEGKTSKIVICNKSDSVTKISFLVPVFERKLVFITLKPDRCTTYKRFYSNTTKDLLVYFKIEQKENNRSQLEKKFQLTDESQRQPGPSALCIKNGKQVPFKDCTTKQTGCEVLDFNHVKFNEGGIANIVVNSRLTKAIIRIIPFSFIGNTACDKMETIEMEADLACENLITNYAFFKNKRVWGLISNVISSSTKFWKVFDTTDKCKGEGTVKCNFYVE